MQKRDVLRRLRRLSYALNARCEDINFGGCAVVAAMVGRRLQRMGIPCDVATPDWSRNGLWASAMRNNVRKRNDVRQWDREGLSRNHLAIRFELDGELFIWDTDGAVRGGRKFGRWDDGEPRYECWAPFGKGMQVRECGAIAGEAWAWNRSFDRAQIPTMQRLVSEFL